MGDHVKPKLLCCSYNSDFESMVIKHEKEITTKFWLGNCVLLKRMYSVGSYKKDY